MPLIEIVLAILIV